MVGAAWVFTRSNGAWTQQQKLTATDPVGPSHQGSSVHLSADGNTALIGGFEDNSDVGAAWVFTRSNGVWTQQQKLTGNDSVGQSKQGISVALTADGNMALVGGSADNSSAGASWVFTRSNGVWTQQGGKLVGTGVVGGVAQQGYGAALSGDGRTAIVGGIRDNDFTGAAWVFFQNPAASHDFDGDLKSDIAWRHNTGVTALWLMNGAQVAQSGNLGAVPNNWHIVGQRDFNGDGKHDLLWRDNSGNLAFWLLDGMTVTGTVFYGNVPTNWSVAGTADFNADGRGDILWRDSDTGTVAIWFFGEFVLFRQTLGSVPSNWVIAGTGDLNGDGRADIFWRDSNTGTIAFWLIDDFKVKQSGSLGTVPLNWVIAGIGDFNGDGRADILWRDSNAGTVAIWFFGEFVLAKIPLGSVPLEWQIAETGDFNGDGKSDILWRNTTTGDVAIWSINELLQVSGASIVGTVGLEWTIQSVNAN